MTEAIKDILKKHTKESVEPAMTETLEICGAFRDVALKILPDNLEGRYRIAYTKNKTLFIEVQNAATAQEFHVYKHVIIEKISTQKGILLNDIVFRQMR
ncbi:DciA family protein [Patescibacteria group bacterium]